MDHFPLGFFPPPPFNSVCPNCLSDVFVHRVALDAFQSVGLDPFRPAGPYLLADLVSCFSRYRVPAFPLLAGRCAHVEHQADYMRWFGTAGPSRVSGIAMDAGGREKN